MDTGYGICRSCVDWLLLRRQQEIVAAMAEQRPARDIGMGPLDIMRTYGSPGLHYADLTE